MHTHTHTEFEPTNHPTDLYLFSLCFLSSTRRQTWINVQTFGCIWDIPPPGNNHHISPTSNQQAPATNGWEDNPKTHLDTTHALRSPTPVGSLALCSRGRSFEKALAWGQNGPNGCRAVVSTLLENKTQQFYWTKNNWWLRPIGG